MHELAIAGSVLEGALRHADGGRVTKVHVRVGHLRQVVPSALSFGWDAVTRGTAAEGAELEIEPVEAVGACGTCGEESVQDRFPFRCPACDGLDVRPVRGDELVIDWLEVEEVETCT